VSTFRRLLGSAQKALDAKSSGSSSSQGSDWRSLVRNAADTLTGDSPSQHSRGPSSSRDAASWRDSAPSQDSASSWGSTGSQESAASRGPGVGIPTTSMPSFGDRRSAGGTGRDADSATSADAPVADLSEADRRAIARYDYLVRTAEPDQLERVHREAFEKLTPQQRTQLTATMRTELPEGERPRTDAPQDLARSATRLGALDPRRLTRLLGRSGGEGRERGASARGAGVRGAGALGAGALGAGALGAGALGAGGLLAVVAGGAVVTSIGGSLLQDAVGAGIDIDSLAPDLAGDLGGLTEGLEGFGEFETIDGIEGLGGLGGLDEGIAGIDGAADGLGGVTDGLGGLTDGLGDTVSGAGEQVSGLGDRISDLGLGDLFGR